MWTLVESNHDLWIVSINGIEPLIITINIIEIDLIQFTLLIQSSVQAPAIRKVHLCVAGLRVALSIA